MRERLLQHLAPETRAETKTESNPARARRVRLTNRRLATSKARTKKNRRRTSKRPQAEAEPEKEGEMSPKQAAALLESMKDEEQKVQLDEHRRVRPVYKDW